MGATLANASPSFFADELHHVLLLILKGEHMLPVSNADTSWTKIYVTIECCQGTFELVNVNHLSRAISLNEFMKIGLKTLEIIRRSLSLTIFVIDCTTINDV